MTLPKLLLFFAGFYVAFRLLHYFLVVKALLGLRFQRPGGELRDIHELPEYLRAVFDKYAPQLHHLGFTFSHAQLFDNHIVGALSRQWNMVYFNGSDSYANVVIAGLPEPHEPAKVEFITIFPDGTRLVTLNGVAHNLIGQIPNATIIDPYAPTLDQQHSAHLEKLANLGRTTVAVTPADYLAGDVDNGNDYIDWLIEHGYLKSLDDHLWRLRLAAAMRHAFKSIRALRKVARLRAAQRKSVTAGTIESVDVPVEVEVDAYLRMQEILKPSDSGFAWKLMVFIISLTVGIAVFGVAFSFQVAVWLIAALFVHELGHYIGMAIFSFADRQILFLPLIGAATLGTKTDATPIQRALVYMLGPALGLIAGTALILAGMKFDIESLRFGGALFLILNYLNLVPIVPLDGGRLFELALFSRVPALKSAFYIASLVVIAIAAIAFHDPVLGIVGLAMFFGARGQVLLNLAHSRLNTQIRDRQIERTRDAILPEVFATLKQKTFARLPFARRYAVRYAAAGNLLNNLLQAPADVSATILSLFLYVITFSLPLLIAFAAAFYIAFTDTF